VPQIGFDSQASVVSLDIHTVPAQLDGVNGHRLNSWHAKWAAGSNIEAGTMAGAFDLVSHQFSLGKRAAVVGADIVDSVVSAVDIEHGDGTAVDFDKFFAPCRELFAGRNFYE
jgi:hypothetical protein